MITVKELCFDYPGKRALHNVSFTIPTGSITALVGPNGAGKTTLLGCLAGLRDFSSGEIIITHNHIEYKVAEEPRKVHQLCGYLSDSFGLYDELTVKQCLRYMAWSRGCPEHLVENQIQITAHKLHLEEYLNKKAGTLSRGLAQRLAIAQTIIQEPKILFLDEPASGLDPQARYELSQLLLALQKHGLTIIVSSHILSELEDYCTHMLVLDKGHILGHCEITPEHKLKDQNQKNMQALYLELINQAL